LIRRLPSSVLAISVAVLLGACASGPRTPPSNTAAGPRSPDAAGAVLASDRKYVVYVPLAEDTLESVATKFLREPRRAWEIAAFNRITATTPGEALVVPLEPVNPRGVHPDGYQTIPILAYHRIGTRASRMFVSAEKFEAQLEFLRRNDYRVIRLADLPDFLDGRRPLPPKSVVITFDDGHVSTYQHAFPLLVRYGYPATFFLYTDFLGAKEALSWPQIREMAATGLMDFQSHSKTHANLWVRLPGESERDYRRRLDTEIRASSEAIRRNLGQRVQHFAYPLGDANQAVLDAVGAAKLSLGLTVNPGGNAFFAHPFLLRRTMVFGEYDLAAFEATLQVFGNVDLR
jgi:peptidoglycan/xylan/chitin deacetylase (PgdA/CDA1 family)